MLTTLDVYDYTLILVVLSFSIFIGLFTTFTGKNEGTMEGYLMGGRNMSVTPVAFSLFATMMSAIFVLGTPADVYMYGIQYVMFTVTVPFSAYFVSTLMLPVFYNMGITSLNEYLLKRFGKSMKTIASFLYIFQTTCYSAVVLYSPAIALNAITGFSTWGCIITLTIVCIVYSSMGGLKAVLWTDFMQSFFMFATLIAIIVKGTLNVGSLKETFTMAQKGGRLEIFKTSFSFEERYTIWNTLIQSFIYIAGYYGSNQTQMQRVISVNSLEKAKRAILLSVPIYIIFSWLGYWCGIVLYAIYHECDPILKPNSTLTSQDQMVPNTIMILFGQYPAIPGLCITGILSATLSTISSSINSVTTVIMKDFVRPFNFFTGSKNHWEIILAKLIAVCCGVTCVLVTIIVSSFESIWETCLVLNGITTGPIFAVFCLGLFTVTANEKGTLIGLLIGFVVGSWIGFGSLIMEVKTPSLIRSIEGCPNSLYNGTEFNMGDHFPNYQTDVLNKDIFPLFKISYLWYVVIGFITVLIFGYLSSYLINHFQGKEKVDKELISPQFRKWLA